MSPSIYKIYTDVNNECPLNRHSVILNKKRVPKGTLKVISYNLTLGSSPSYDDSHIHIIYMPSLHQYRLIQLRHRLLSIVIIYSCHIRQCTVNQCNLYTLFYL